MFNLSSSPMGVESEEHLKFYAVLRSVTHYSESGESLHC